MSLRSRPSVSSFNKKNPNQLCPKKMINKYTNTLDVLLKLVPWHKHKYDINIFLWLKKCFEKQQTKAKFDLF